MSSARFMTKVLENQPPGRADGLHIVTLAGRLMANILAGVAAYDTEVRLTESSPARHQLGCAASARVDRPRVVESYRTGRERGWLRSTYCVSLPYFGRDYGCVVGSSTANPSIAAAALRG